MKPSEKALETARAVLVELQQFLWGIDDDDGQPIDQQELERWAFALDDFAADMKEGEE